MDHLKLQKIPMKGTAHASNGSSVGKEAAINQLVKKANSGDLLWVQFRGSSWWPALVVDESTITAICKPKERRKGEVLIRLYGSYNYLFIDPISSQLEFEDILNEYNGSHIAILKESLEQDLRELRFGTSKEKPMKTKGKVGADASRERTVKEKQKLTSKTETKKVPPFGRSSSRQSDAKSPTKKSKEASLDSARTMEKDSKKRKNEVAQKSKPNSSKSASRKEEQDMERKKPKTSGASYPRTSAGRASAGATPKASLKRGRSLSDKSEQGDNKKKKHSDTRKNLSPNSPNSRSAKSGHSSSGKMESPRTKVQTQKTGHKKLGKSSMTLEEPAKEPSARQLKIMRFLGLIAPVGSPFIRSKSISSSTKLTS